MTQIKWFFSNNAVQWQQKTPTCFTGEWNLSTDGREYQKMFGFGGCFNEIGFQTLKQLSDTEQKDVMKDLFYPSENGCNFSLCRLPIGANDYSFDWYSLDETPGDYELADFSIERDKKALIPYIRAALAYLPDLNLFASPWSPPTWMKHPPVYNWGKLIFTKEIQTAYAFYFVKFVEEYQKMGIKIDQIHVQNEPVANQKFPSCMWTGTELRDFIRDYLGPAFRKAGLSTEIWLGTINAPGCDYRKMIFDKWADEDYDFFANTVLRDDSARQYISGVSYQWGGKIAIQRTFESWWPRIRLMQSENECGFGDNTWKNALYNWTMMKHYIGNGAESYIYWNMILPPDGVSTWGDPQNALITVSPTEPKIIKNPDYYLMKHFSSFIKRGAIRLGIQGDMAADSLIFHNPDGSYVIEAMNPFETELILKLNLSGIEAGFELEPKSLNSIIIDG